ncbi:type II secretion system protein F (GspF) [Shimia isoporae]|uniref:Type II secretion system protein F (GspF) n=1 Tax=Shimia isoporae TaxID=647720 RepID=A0A4V2Q1X9_9RHOB|nr:type II secretion system F family protein [Shimia isoporae]TCK99852.1 type II secretion system protein F (GspF) [Shimia isoporae]
MRPFSYVAYDADGARTKGLILADTESDASARLRAQGLFVSELSVSRQRTNLTERLRRSARLNSDLQAVFARQMAVLLSAEMPLEAALEAIRTSGNGTTLSTVATRARAALMQGSTLAEALEEAGAGFPAYVTAAIHAGEGAGELAAVFEELARHLENLGNEKAEIVSALVYPAFVAAVSFLVCAILMINVAPEIVAMFEISGQPLPPLTQYVLAVSDWIQDNFTLVSTIIGGFALLIVASSRLQALRTIRDRFLLRLPLIGRLMRRAAAVQYLRTLALVLASRQTVPVAVQNAARVLDIARFQTEGESVLIALQEGASLSDALDRLSIIPPVARQLIGAGEMSARLAPMTERSAILVESDLTSERKRIAALLEPMLMMLVGAFVLLIVLAVLLPIFDLQAVVAG